MKIQATQIADQFAEAFSMRFARLIITAEDRFWLEAAIAASTGYACSVIGCDAEAGLDQWLPEDQTPDQRPGAALLFFGMSSDPLGKAIVKRVGQCLMTCPTISVFDGLSDAEKRTPLGKHLRYFGDGFQKSKKIAERRYWRVPVMDGEFIVEDTCGIGSGIAGGNLILQGEEPSQTARSAALVARAVQSQPGVITPFPAGVVRSGSKVGSKYPSLMASTNEAYCPSLVGRVETALNSNCHCAYEIVIDGVTQDAVANAMKAGMVAAAKENLIEVTAGNYGGKLGKFHFHLRELAGQLGDNSVTQEPSSE